MMIFLLLIGRVRSRFARIGWWHRNASTSPFLRCAHFPRERRALSKYSMEGYRAPSRPTLGFLSLARREVSVLPRRIFCAKIVMMVPERRPKTPILALLHRWNFGCSNWHHIRRFFFFDYDDFVVVAVVLFFSLSFFLFRFHLVVAIVVAFDLIHLVVVRERNWRRLCPSTRIAKRHILNYLFFFFFAGCRHRSSSPSDDEDSVVLH